MSFSDPEFSEREKRIRDRTNVPGILLIVVGVLNIVSGFWMLQQGVSVLRLTPDQFREQMKEGAKAMHQEKALEDYEKNGMSMEQMQSFTTKSMIGCAVINLLGSLLVIYGGINLRSLNHYGLAVIGSLWALLPCISCSGCCGLGQVAGIWALVVLLSEEVRSAFQ
jgi:hypothetical protein